MTILLDTSTLIWWANESSDLSGSARSAIMRAETVFVSAITAMELSTKLRIGKLPEAALLVEEFDRRCADESFTLLPLTHRHALFAGAIIAEPRDPFDRMLAAQAILEDLTIIASDTAFDALGARRLW